LGQFEFVFSLFGLLLGFSLVEVLGGFGRTLKARTRIRLGWLTPLLGMFVMLDLTGFWLLAWAARDAIPANYLALLCALAVTGLYYLAASLVFPDEPSEWPDLDAHYFAHKRQVIGGVLLCNLLGAGGLVAIGGDIHYASINLLLLILFCAILGAAILVRSKRANLVLLGLAIVQYPVNAVLPWLT
jgi:hypothetical protein